MYNAYGMPSMNQGMTWVESLQQAEQFELPPGCDIALFNKNKDEVYIRSRDRYNIYSTRIFELKEITPVKQNNQYVTREEFEEILQKYLGGIGNVTVQPANGTTSTAEPTVNTSQSASGRKRKADDSDITGVK